MSKTNIGLVAFVEGAEKAQLGYVYGTFGQMCTVALLDQKAKQYPANNLAGGAMRKVGEKWLDRIVADCSGLIKYYLMADNVGEQPVYDPKYDTNLFNIASEKGTIDTMPDIPGICLYLPGHTAVYIGNGQVVEAAGTAYGVVRSKLPNCYTGKKWTHWYKVRWIEYLETKSVAAPIFTAPTVTGLTLDTPNGKDLTVGERYTVLAKCKENPAVTTTGRDVIAVSEPRLDPKGRGWLIDVQGLPPEPVVRHGHIMVTSGGQTVQCNFNVR